MTDVPAHNHLDILPDGIIKLTQTGHQTLASVGQFQAPMDKLTIEYHDKGKKALILVDMTGVTGHDPETREEGRKRLNGDYDAMAICGTSTALRLIVNWLIRAVGDGNKVQFFSTVEEGLAWLRKHQ